MAQIGRVLVVLVSPQAAQSAKGNADLRYGGTTGHEAPEWEKASLSSLNGLNRRQRNVASHRARVRLLRADP
jgi:hypothetical protein